jgi:hypothetical protein
VFRDNGTLSVESGERQTENTFRMAWSPESNGRFRIDMTSLKNDGGKACSDTPEDYLPRRPVVYALFGASRGTMILCGSLAGSDCIGPLKKTAP